MSDRPQIPLNRTLRPVAIRPALAVLAMIASASVFGFSLGSAAASVVHVGELYVSALVFLLAVGMLFPSSAIEERARWEDELSLVRWKSTDAATISRSPRPLAPPAKSRAGANLKGGARP